MGWKKDFGEFLKKREEDKQLRQEEARKEEEARIEKARMEEARQQEIGPPKTDAEIFYSSVVTPALEDLKKELQKHDREITLSEGKGYQSITVKSEGIGEYSYRIKIHKGKKRSFPYAEISFYGPTGKKYVSVRFLRWAPERYCMSDIIKDDVIQHFLSGYKLHLKRFD